MLTFRGRINVYGPEGGEPLYAIYLPAQCPTSTVFAGKNLDQLVITTHNVPFDLRKQVIEGGLGTAEELDERWPHRKGSIYTVQLKGVKGVPKHRVNPLVEQ